MKTLILYYSYGGNTRNIAEHIREALDCDIAEIQTVIPYTGDYDAVVDQGQREK
ncbi:flavodoxin [Lacrimispora brassicae]